MLTDKDSGHKVSAHHFENILSSSIAGATCTGIMNPADKALYLSIKEKRPYLLKTNFTAPFQGCVQAMFQRAFFGSFYFMMQGEMQVSLYPYLHHQLKFSQAISEFGVGLAAGSVDGILKNSTSAIKYHTWGDHTHSFVTSVREMWSKGGVKPFVNGTLATLCRDATYGSTYEMVRWSLRSQVVSDPHQNGRIFLCNFAAAGLSTIMSSPFNYARNMQYAAKPGTKPPAIREVFCGLWHETRESPLSKMSFFQQRFRIGWGTTINMVRMATTQLLVDEIKQKVFKR
jgi:hypothetical protein